MLSCQYHLSHISIFKAHYVNSLTHLLQNIVFLYSKRNITLQNYSLQIISNLRFLNNTININNGGNIKYKYIIFKPSFNKKTSIKKEIEQYFNCKLKFEKGIMIDGTLKKLLQYDNH
jgi:hypothetical protein